MTAPTLPGKAYCNCLAQEHGLDPVGHAGSFDDAIVMEVPLPWKYDMTQKVGALPQEVIDLFALWLQRYQAGEGYPHLPLAVAPDPETTREGYRRVLFYTRPAGAFARFDKVEYLVPEAEIGALVWALYEDPDALPPFDPYRVPGAGAIRDILVCTHGTIDAACARFGYPLYKYMRDTFSGDDLRVWRVSHFGGHVFAPTLMDMPTGHYWAYVGESQAEQIIHRSGDVAALRGYYRGWAGLLGGFPQAAECALWQKYGWDWFDYLKSGGIVAQDEADAPQWADVCIHYAVMAGTVMARHAARVETIRTIETPHSTAHADPYPYPQYRVVADTRSG